MTVALVYHYFAQYRAPVLGRLLERIPDLVLVSSDGRDSGSIRSLHPAQCDVWRGRWRVVDNRWLLGGRLLWQKGVLHATRDAQTIIALGSVTFLSTWLLLLRAKLRGQRVFLWTHGVYGNESPAKLAARLAFYGLADGLLLYGNYARLLLLRRGLRAERLHVIYNSLDTQEQERVFRSRDAAAVASRRAKTFGNARPVLAFLGRLTPEKRLDLLVRAAGELRRLGRDVNCLFVGDGSVRPELEALATASGVRTHFAGETYREEEIGLCLMMADAVVAPGNVGLTAMHALAYGVPVITHSDFTAQMPEFEAIRPGVSGAFFRRNDVGDLVRVIREWLDAHPVRDHRVEEACRGIVSACYSPDVQAEIIARVTGAGPAGRKDAP